MRGRDRQGTGKSMQMHLSKLPFSNLPFSFSPILFHQAYATVPNPPPFHKHYRQEKYFGIKFRGATSKVVIQLPERIPAELNSVEFPEKKLFPLSLFPPPQKE